jgi:hypothetical protein
MKKLCIALVLILAGIPALYAQEKIKVAQPSTTASQVDKRIVNKIQVAPDQAEKPLAPTPPSFDCNQDNCYWQEGYACINGWCEQGHKVITDRYWIEEYQQYEIHYHYEFSDGSWSSDYSEYE